MTKRTRLAAKTNLMVNRWNRQPVIRKMMYTAKMIKKYGWQEVME